MHRSLVVNPSGGAEARRVFTQPALHDNLMERIVDPANMRRAWKRVKANQGAPGSDGMTLEDFPTFARLHWPAIRQALLDGTYQPKPVRRVSIAKPNGPGNSTSHRASPHTDIRPDIFRVEFRFSAGTLRPRSSTAGTADYRRGLSHRRGFGFGEILRPSQPRCTDGPRGQEGER